MKVELNDRISLLQKEIAAALDGFHQDTGLIVDHVSASYFEGNMNEAKVVEVDVSLRTQRL